MALVVMSVGMLGIASLYATTLQAKTTSLSRMKAVNLATDMADRIRANPSAGTSYALASGIGTAGTTATDCVTVTCIPSDMAKSDLYLWSAALASSNTITGLPGVAKRSIVWTDKTATTPQIFVITLSWYEVNNGTAANPLTYSLQVQI